MTLETLKQCRQAAIRVRKAKARIAEHKATAGSIGGARYDDAPRERGEPISRQEAYVEKLERLQEELKQKEETRRILQQKVLHAISGLTKQQKQLICGYYGCGCSWEEVNAVCGLTRQQSCYQVRKAFEKILKKT